MQQKSDFNEQRKIAPDFNTIFSFGSQSHQNYGQLIFQDKGGIYGYDNDNEHSWIIEGNNLCLLNTRGEVTSRFERHHNFWIGQCEGNRWPFYLLPLLEMGMARNSALSKNGFLVNSIPKSGTYFMEDALNQLGAESVRLHLSGRDVVDDYRNLADEDIHVDPMQSRIYCPVYLVTQLLHGRTAVGHVESIEYINMMRAQDVTIFNLRRNLRDVLVSLYRFKFGKVKSFGDIDLHWRAMSERSRFIAFLLTYAQRDIAHIKALGEMILSDTDSIHLTYEGMCMGELSEESYLKIEAVKSGFAAALSAMLKSRYGKNNPTYSGQRSDWTHFWNDDVESFFITCGLSELNHRLGY